MIIHDDPYDAASYLPQQERQDLSSRHSDDDANYHAQSSLPHHVFRRKALLVVEFPIDVAT